MQKKVKVALAQLDLTVGDVVGNTAKIIDYANRAKDELEADLVVFPELSVCGYPPEDLLFHVGLRYKVENALADIRDSVAGIAILFGYPEYADDVIYNACAVVQDGEVIAHYRKQRLPNYSVFDEERYFSRGKSAVVFSLNGIRIGLNICEDVWSPEPIASNRTAGAECVIVINGSPFEKTSQSNREQEVRSRVLENKIPLIYVNMVGGQDELVFDGGSFVMDSAGEIRFRAPAFDEGLHVITLQASAAEVTPDAATCTPVLETDANIYKALVTGTRDYIRKHGFPGVVLGLSGGIDSALVATIACDAIGHENVRAVMMPFRYTSNMSQEDAEMQASTLGMRYDVIPIEPMYVAAIEQLEPVLGDREADATEENIQARCRGLLLMAISNKTGRMLLTTGNKSEMSVGYATLFGDMVGGYNAIKDVPKILVYELAKYRNSISPVIPERVITREPSAELRPDQIDSDSLPPYEILDPILELYVEQDCAPADIVEQGYAAEYVSQVIRMVDRNEYKRRQAAPGVRITKRAFGRDRRYPITSGFRPTVDW